MTSRNALLLAAGAALVGAFAAPASAGGFRFSFGFGDRDCYGPSYYYPAPVYYSAPARYYYRDAPRRYYYRSYRAYHRPVRHYRYGGYSTYGHRRSYYYGGRSYSRYGHGRHYSRYRFYSR